MLPAALPSAAVFVIVATSASETALIVPPFREIRFVAFRCSKSSALCVADAAATTKLKVNSSVVLPEA